MDELGFVGDTLKVQWEVGYSHLVTYKNQFEDCLVPNKYKTESSFRLGIWVSQQRTNHKSDGLNDDRIRRLNELGFVWDAR